MTIPKLISIGTGKPIPHSGGERADQLLESMIQIVTDTENTAKEFANENYHEPKASRPAYHRFNVEQGLENVGLEEWKKFGKLNAATREYLNGKRQELDECIAALVSAICK